MKILVVQDWLRSGGTERQSVLLANAFAAAEHDTTLLTFRPGGRIASTVAPAVPRLALQPFDLRLDWFAPRLHTAALNLAPEIVLCMGRMANCYAGGMQRCLPQAAVVVTMRTGKALPCLFRRSLKLARHIIANSADARDLLIDRYGVGPHRVTVIHNSLVFSPEGREVTADATESVRNTLRAQHGASVKTTVLVCVAMFRPEKNQRELIEIAAGLPPDSDWQLWLAGDGAARRACEVLALSRNVRDRVAFLGFERNPSNLYAAADVAVHASSSEGLSNFLIEAQAHGLPAVAYQAQGIRECFVPERTGWAIPRGDRSGFRDKLIRLMYEPPLERLARRTEARAFARIEFDPTRQVRAYLDLFERLRI